MVTKCQLDGDTDILDHTHTPMEHRKIDRQKHTYVLIRAFLHAHARHTQAGQQRERAAGGPMLKNPHTHAVMLFRKAVFVAQFRSPLLHL